MPLPFHILDVFARDEKILTETVKQYADAEDSDDEFKSSSKNKGNYTSGQHMIIHLFGKTANGTTIRCDVKGFKPFFFIKSVGGSKAIVEQARSAVRNYIQRHMPQASSAIELTPCEKKELFGYTQERMVPMLKITMNSIQLFHAVKKLFLNAKTEPELKKLGARRDTLGAPFNQTVPIVYEANLDPMLRFLHLRNLKPCGWCSVDGYDETDLPEDEAVVLECEWEDINPSVGTAASAPFTIASWDIECMSNSGAFPMATKGDPVIQIGVILSKLGSPLTEKHIFVLDTCDNIPEGVVHSFPTEKKMLLAWFEWIVEKDVDIMMGYNIFGFDEKYVWERCEQLAIQGRLEIQQMNRLHEENGEMKLEEKRLSSSAMGDNLLYLWTTPGRLRVDVYHYIKRGYQLGSYKLDDTSRNFLGENIKAIAEKVDCWQLTIGPTKQDLAMGRSVVLLNDNGDSLCDKLSIVAIADGTLCVEVPEDVLVDEVAKWAIVKDDVTPNEMFKMHLGTSADRAIIARYCIQDCQLVLDLFKKLDIFNNAMSMANVCSVPVPYIFLRGQGIKIESLMFKYCYEREQCIVVMAGGGNDGEKYEGAIVLDPTPGFYTVPVGVADFASLYPSSIISENISHDTLVWVKDYTAEGKLMANQWGSDEYDNLPGVAYTDIEYDNFIDDPEDTRKFKRQIKRGIRVCRYAQDKIGTIPQIVQGLLAARKAKRKEGEKEQDPFRKALLDAEQLAYKLTANSLYGQLGSGTFKVRLKALAASVTAYGRKQIMFAKAVIEGQYGPESGNPSCCASAQTVYGDSVKGDTALYCKINGTAEIVRIDELAVDGWKPWHETKEAIELVGTSIWTEKGWTAVERLIRHRLAPGKRMFRVLTHTGVVDCTEDHSLVAADGSAVKPSEIQVGTELLHNSKVHLEFTVRRVGQPQDEYVTEAEAWAMGLFMADGSCDAYSCSGGIKYTWAINKANTDVLLEAAGKLPFETKVLDTIESSGVYKLVPVGNIREPTLRYRKLFYNAHREKRVPSCILNASLGVVKSFMAGFYTGDGDKVGQALGNYRWDQKGKEVSSGLAILAQRLGYTVSINDRVSKPDFFRITCTMKTPRKNPLAIKKLYEIPTNAIDYVYDLQTENHHFAVGPGSLVVHNTDSLFIAFNPKDASGKPLEGQEGLEKTIALTEEAGKLVTKALKAPHDFEFDKVYWPFIIFSKKRYVGHKYEVASKYSLTFMGIALKRRDYAAISKRFYSSALQILLNEKDVPKAAEVVRTMAKDFIEGKFGLQPLTISKSLKSEYKSTPAHKILADRIAAREPGNAPASGDRLQYIYVQAEVGQKAADLQGDRIETPAYIKEKGLKPDYMYYIDHQIANPLCQLFGIVVDQIPGFANYRPKGGWSDIPEALVVQRETAAYSLLFDEAIQINSKGAKRAFAELLGASVETVPRRSVRQATISSTKIAKQSTLDSMFSATMQLNAVKSVQKAKKNVTS